MNLICGKTRFGIFQKASSHLSEWFNSVMKLTMILNKHMSSCQLIVTVLMKFPPPPKSYANIFFRGAQDLYLVQQTLIMQKIIKKTIMGAF